MGWSVSEGRAQWDAFLREWPSSRLRGMTLDEYSNERREDALVYWLEFRLTSLGGVAGGSAFKFGVARRGDGGEKKAAQQGRRYDERYLWLTKFGESADEAFLAVRRAILDVVDASQAGRLDAVDASPLGELVRWKLAFLYQPRERARVLPIYKREALLYLYRRLVDPQARASAPLSAIYEGLRGLAPDADPIEQAAELWALWEARAAQGARDWLLPLRPFGWEGEALEALACAERVEGGSTPSEVEEQLVEKGAQPGDRLALWDGARVRARGVLRAVGVGSSSWEQEPCDLPLVADGELGAELFEVTTWNWRSRIWEAQEAAQVPVAEESPPAPLGPPECRILVGPPGTGKTWLADRLALRLCGEAVEGLDAEGVRARLRALQAEGRVERLTLHPSYGYEDLIEGLRPVLGAGELGYEVADGALKRIALLATSEGLEAFAPSVSFGGLWEALLAALAQAEEPVLVEGLEEGLWGLRRGARGQVEAQRVLSVEGSEPWVSEAPLTVARASVAAVWEARGRLGTGKPSAESLKRVVERALGAQAVCHPQVLWPVVEELEKLARRAQKQPANDARGRREQARAVLQAGAWEQLRFDGATRGYVLIVDEINRGNLGKVLGELITLLEPSRRLKASDEWVARLAASGERFGLPPNLHLIGTMNSADRSIALLDVALRRRFAFEEVPPQRALLEAELRRRGADEGWARLIGEVLDTINARIRFVLDREHQLGHAYWMDAHDEAGAREVLVERVIPLLQEYFYDAWDKICMVLGCPYDERGQPLRDAPHAVKRGPLRYVAPAIEVEVLSERAVLGISRGDHEPRLDHRASRKLSQPDLSPDAVRLHLEAILHAPLDDDLKL
jgi:5-methylcytosine-specific restriction protein B